MQTKVNLNRQAMINIGLVYLLVMLQSWITNVIQGDAIFPWICGGFSLQASFGKSFILLVIMLSMSLIIAWKIYKRRRTFLPMEIRRIGTPDQVEPRAILVLVISRPLGWAVDIAENCLKHERGTSLPLHTDLHDMLHQLAALSVRERFSWEQLLRAMDKHVPRLEKVVLLGSSGSDGTAKHFQECRDFLRYFFPKLNKEQFISKEADFENIEQLKCLYEGLVASGFGSASDIMIDVTGGTKVVSIAAAIVTMQYPEVEFQYVETEGSKRVRSFNVAGASYDELEQAA